MLPLLASIEVIGLEAKWFTDGMDLNNWFNFSL